MNWYYIKTKITDAFYDFKNGIRNLITYLPIVWKTRHWEWTYTLRFIIFLMQRQEKSLRNSIIANGPLYADEMAGVIKIFNEILEIEDMDMATF